MESNFLKEFGGRGIAWSSEMATETVVQVDGRSLGWSEEGLPLSAWDRAGATCPFCQIENVAAVNASRHTGVWLESRVRCGHEAGWWWKSERSFGAMFRGRTVALSREVLQTAAR